MAPSIRDARPNANYAAGRERQGVMLVHPVFGASVKQVEARCFGDASKNNEQQR
jgi:hypothetical protein